MFGGIVGNNPLGLVSQVALTAATGGTSSLLQVALRSIVSGIGQQVIQQLGQDMGLPQSIVDVAQGGFAGAIGDTDGATRNYNEAIASASQDFGGTPVEEGEAQQAADALNNLLLNAAKNTRDNADPQAAKGGKGGSLLMKIAIALGKLMDQKMNEMSKLTDQIGDLGTIDAKNQSKMGELTGKLQGLSQEVSLLSNAMTNSIKTIGEAASTIARKN